MKLWARVGLAFVVGVALLAGVEAMSPKAEVSVNCSAQRGSGQCVIDNKGGKGGDVMFDMVLVCHDGQHVAQVSAHVDARNHVTKIVDSFSPEVGMFTKCAGIDYKNMTVR